VTGRPRAARGVRRGAGVAIALGAVGLAVLAVLAGASSAEGDLQPSTREDRLQIIDARLDARAEQLRAEDPTGPVPDVDPVVVDADAYDGVYARCVQEGVAARTDWARRVLPCEALVDESTLAFIRGPYELRELWFQDETVLKPCLVRHGLRIAPHRFEPTSEGWYVGSSAEWAGAAGWRPVRADARG